MSKLFKIILVSSLCVMAIFSLSSCRKQKTYEEGYNDGYADGQYDASNALSDYSFEMYKEGYDEAYGDFVYGIIEDKAIHYAVDHGGWHPEEAMGIIDAYEKGQSYYGKLQITEKDYKDAVRSLCCYYEYFYNSRYEDDVECGYDFYE